LELKEGTNYKVGAQCIKSVIQGQSIQAYKRATRRGCVPLKSDRLVDGLIAELRRAAFPRHAVTVSSFEPMRLSRFLTRAAGEYTHTKLVLDAVFRTVPSAEQQRTLFAALRRVNINSISVLPRAVNVEMVARAQHEFEIAVEIGLPIPGSKGSCIHEQPLSLSGHLNQSAVDAIVAMQPNVICTDRPDIVLLQTGR